MPRWCPCTKTTGPSSSRTPTPNAGPSQEGGGNSTNYDGDTSVEEESKGKGASRGRGKAKGKNPRKKKKTKKSKRSRPRESSVSSSDKDRDRGHKCHRRRSSRSTSSSSSSSALSEDSNWAEFFDAATVVKIQGLLKVAAPKLPPEVMRGRSRNAFDGAGEILVVKKLAGGKEKWLKESCGEKAERYANYSGAISRLGHTGGDRALRQNFRACLIPLKAVEKTLMTSPMTDVVRRGLADARAVLYDPLDLLQIERETNSTITGFVESKHCKGGQREVNLAVEKYVRQASPGRGSGGGGGGRTRGGRQGYNT
jgi:hypothetical protein